MRVGWSTLRDGGRRLLNGSWSQYSPRSLDNSLFSCTGIIFYGSGKGNYSKPQKPLTTTHLSLDNQYMEYYVSLEAQENGDHTIHRKDCPMLPKMEELKYIGDFLFCMSAITEAEKQFKQVNGCYHCTQSHYTKDS